MKKYLLSLLFVPSLLLAQDAPKQKPIEEASDCEIKLEICNTQVQFAQADRKVTALADELKKREAKQSHKAKKEEEKKNE